MHQPFLDSSSCSTQNVEFKAFELAFEDSHTAPMQRHFKTGPAASVSESQSKFRAYLVADRALQPCDLLVAMGILRAST